MMAMIMGGFTEDRVADIRGKADREPLLKEDTKNPQNRRISIVLLRRYGNDAKAGDVKDSGTKDGPNNMGAVAPDAPPIPPPADFSNKLPEGTPAEPASPALLPGDAPRLTPPLPTR
jgi:hypothetical protein